MKKIAIICAMEDEAASLVEKLNLERKNDICGNIPLYEGIYNKKKVIVTVCGAGKVYAAMTCQCLIMLYKPDLMLNLGISGGIIPGIKRGDICISSDFVQYDYDISAIGYKKGQIDGIKQINFPADKETSDLLYKIAKTVQNKENVHIGTIGTGDRFVSSAALASEISETFDAISCEMEGGAIAQVCFINNIKFCAVRSISDNANEDAPYDFNEFRKVAVANSTAIMIEFLNS